jgi:hypothetical protein
VRSLDTHEEMEVVGEKGPGEKYDAIAPLSPTEDADQDLVEARAGSQEKSAVKGAAGQLEDRAAGRNIEQGSSHLVYRDEMSRDDLSRNLWHLSGALRALRHLSGAGLLLQFVA